MLPHVLLFDSFTTERGRAEARPSGGHHAQANSGSVEAFDDSCRPSLGGM